MTHSENIKVSIVVNRLFTCVDVKATFALCCAEVHWVFIKDTSPTWKWSKHDALDYYSLIQLWGKVAGVNRLMIFPLIATVAHHV